MRLMSRSRKRKLSGWTILLAPILVIGGAIVAVVMWPFR